MNLGAAVVGLPPGKLAFVSLGSSSGDVRRRCVAAAMAVGLLLVLLAPGDSTAAGTRFQAYGSCAVGKPFKPASRCAFDRPEHAQGTIVFRSHAGRRMLKVCQRIFGLSFKGRQCLKTEKPTAYEAIPFHLNGAPDAFKLVVTLYVKAPGTSAAYKQVARVPLTFAP